MKIYLVKSNDSNDGFGFVQGNSEQEVRAKLSILGIRNIALLVAKENATAQDLADLQNSLTESNSHN
jgi:hypothetical protein